VTLEGWKVFGYENYQPTGRVVETEQLETRAADFHIKNLPKGQIELLMTDETEGTIHTLLHVRPPADVSIPGGSRSFTQAAPVSPRVGGSEPAV